MFPSKCITFLKCFIKKSPATSSIKAYLSINRANSKGTTKKIIEQYNNEIGPLIGNMEQNAQIYRCKLKN